MENFWFPNGAEALYFAISVARLLKQTAI